MTKAELINAVTADLNKSAVESCKVSKGTVERTINAIFDNVIPNQLAEGKEVSISGFGKFTPNLKPAHTARNPQSGGTVEVGEKLSLKFKPSTGLKEKLN